MNDTKKAISAAVIKALGPLVRILIKNGLSFDEFSELAKRVFVQVATNEFSIPGRKQSKSRVSILTGLTRKEVLRIKNLSEPDDIGAQERYNRAVRIISAWRREKRFTDKKGSPLPLLITGRGPSFDNLVKRFSGDMPTRAVLDELERVGAVARLKDGRVRLKTRAYIPQTVDADKLGVLGTDVSHLIKTIDHNISKPDETFLQRKVSYDNLPSEILPMLQKLSKEKGQALLEELDRLMSQHDRDANPSVKGTGRRVAGVGIYYFENDFQEEKK